MLCAYFYSPEHVTDDSPELLKKWDEKKTDCNMVHPESCKIKKNNEDTDIHVVTCIGEKTRVELEHGEGSGHQPNTIMNVS